MVIFISFNNLKGKDPEKLYDESNKFAGTVQDRYLLYVFSCTVYFAEGRRDIKKLKWWNWKDKKNIFLDIEFDYLIK